MIKTISNTLMLIVIVSALVLTGLLAPVSSPVIFAQGDDPTFTIVGGVDESQTYADQEVDGFTFTDFTYESLYPFGLEFRVTITPPEEDVTISAVTLFYTFATGLGGRIAARPGNAENEWIAVPYEAAGLPPWHEIDAYWGVRTETASVNTEPVHAVYYDRTREWYRAEGENILVYWYGMPENLGQIVVDAMAANQEKYLMGFGETLDFRPMAVIFPPGPAWNEYRGDTTIDDTDFGFTGTTIPEAGSTIQRIRTLEPAAQRANCIWNPDEPDAEYQMNLAASTVSHEVAHLHQQETGVSRGPTWWIEGQATFFEVYEEYPIHERLRTLAELRGGDMPTLQGAGPSRGTQITSEDGCTHMGYDMGASFMMWLTDTYGGIEAYRAVVEEQRRGATLGEALEAVTGHTLLELENDWRAFLGVGPVPAEVLDPALALAEPLDPFLEIGETVVLPAMPFTQPIYTRPTEQSVSNTPCFANTAVTILRAGNDGTTNWYEVDCMGLVGWMSQLQIMGPQ